eukprot:TRINITY_DN6709_c0_g1_i1.p1 TRINITY_DN6709_c0_g1~~TRINITY_DN6709_c0_g1_i1.p1  ORF type:complete len:393 (-),score=88.68 TRINITY_DN6709_c0_g1_i1:783-1961(-)
MALTRSGTSMETETATMLSSCGFEDKCEQEDKEPDTTDVGSSCCSSDASDSEDGSYEFKHELLQSWKDQQVAKTAGTKLQSQRMPELQLRLSNRCLRSSVAPPRQVRMRGHCFRGTQLPSIPCTPAAASSTWAGDSSSDSSGDEALDGQLRRTRVCNAFSVVGAGESDQVESSVEDKRPSPQPCLPSLPPPQQQANLDFRIPPLPEPPAWDSDSFALPVAPPSHPAPAIAAVQSYASSSPPIWDASESSSSSKKQVLPSAPVIGQTSRLTLPIAAPPGLESALSPKEQARQAVMAKARAERLPLKARIPNAAERLLKQLDVDVPAKLQLPCWPEFAGWKVQLKKLDAKEPAKKYPSSFLIEEPLQFCNLLQEVMGAYSTTPAFRRQQVPAAR